MLGMFLTLSISRLTRLSLMMMQGLAIIVTIITICDPRAILQYGAFELAGTLGEVFQAATVLLDEVLIRFTIIILLGLVCVIVGCIKEATGHDLL